MVCVRVPVLLVHHSLDVVRTEGGVVAMLYAFITFNDIIIAKLEIQVAASIAVSYNNPMFRHHHVTEEVFNSYKVGDKVTYKEGRDVQI